MTGPEAASPGLGPTDADEPVGSVAEEAFKLLRALAPDSGSATAGDHQCTTAWCPVCQVVGFVRTHPEAVATVTHSAAAFARSVRDLVDTALAPQEEQ